MVPGPTALVPLGGLEEMSTLKLYPTSTESESTLDPNTENIGIGSQFQHLPHVLFKLSEP